MLNKIWKPIMGTLKGTLKEAAKRSLNRILKGTRKGTLTPTVQTSRFWRDVSLRAYGPKFQRPTEAFAGLGLRAFFA